MERANGEEKSLYCKRDKIRDINEGHLSEQIFLFFASPPILLFIQLLCLPDTFPECTCLNYRVDSAFHLEHDLSAEQSRWPLLTLHLSTQVALPIVAHLANPPVVP